MDSSSLPNTWDIDQIIEDFDHQGFSILDNAYPQNYVESLVNECNSNLNQFREAAIQNGRFSNIRSDHILWINDDLKIAQHHIQSLKALSQQFNRTFYLGIQEVEAHFACYNAGEFYALHRDNPQGKNGRVISSVYYLHKEWQDDWGGELRLQDKNEIWHIIHPKPNRIALFQSDLLHQVLLSKQQRLSITAWLRQSDGLF